MLLFQCGSVRYISRNSAIRQGLLAEKRNAAAPSIPSRVRRSTKSSYGKEDGVVRKRNSERKRVRPNGQYETGEWVVSTSRGSTLSDINATRSKSRTKESSRDKSQVRSSQMRSKQESPIKAEKQGRPPFSLPYTTAASEFLYGHSAVVAALKANRRQLYKLYIHRRASDKSVDSLDIERLSRSTNVRIVHVNDKWLPLLDKAAKDRPHNGVILEASPLPKPPIHSLGRVSPSAATIAVQPSPQPAEDAAINGAPTTLPLAPRARTPIVLLADSVRDPGNLGGMVRSAYFLGAAALALCTRTCAPLSPAAVKASAGAAEALPVLAVDGAAAFLDASVAQGWRVVAAVAEGSAGSGRAAGITLSRRVRRGGVSVVEECAVEEVLRHPLIVAVGGEGEALRENIRKRAEFFVRINPVRSVDEVGVDSLNVSVAAALICQHLVSASSNVAAKVDGNGCETKELW